MRSVIIVTGTPGTGKTTISKHLCEMYSLRYIDVNRVISSKGLSIGYDEERDCRIVDDKRLVNELKVLIDAFKSQRSSKFNGIVIDSHLSHYLPKSYVNLCIVTRCSLQILKKRLKERGYSAAKVRENLDAEIFDTCRIEALEKGHNVVVVDTGKKIDYAKLMQSLS